MSVLVKGMKMPRACSQCFLYHEAEEGIGTLSDHCGVGWRKIPRKVEKPDWCPLVEIIEPKHGRWIPVTNGRGGFECSVCANYAPSYQDGVEWLSRVCPTCGAKMDEVEE